MGYFAGVSAKKQYLLRQNMVKTSKTASFSSRILACDSVTQSYHTPNDRKFFRDDKNIFRHCSRAIRNVLWTKTSDTLKHEENKDAYCTHFSGMKAADLTLMIIFKGKRSFQASR